MFHGNAKFGIMTEELNAVEVGALSDAQLSALRLLRVSKRQEVLGKSFRESIEDWEFGARERVLGLCFLINECPIGMVLFRRRTEVEDQEISMHGLKIALPWQQKGYGHQALGYALQYVKAVWPDARLLKLAVDAENRPAVAVYRKRGMTDSGPIFEGPNGKEHHMKLLLRQ